MSEQHQVERVAVVGAGTMGGGIAVQLLQAGLQVDLYDPADAALEKARQRITRRADAAAQTRLQLHLNLKEAVSAADFVIEAVPEKLELKRKLFAELDRLVPPGAILASNTSELSITVLGGATLRPAQVVGMHWFN